MPLKYCPVVILVIAGFVVSIVNIAHVEFPARSVAINSYVPSRLIVSPLFIVVPFTVAVLLKVIVTFPE